MKKKILLVSAALALMLACVGCAPKDDASNIVDKTSGTASSAVSTSDSESKEVREALDTFADGADENADMSKIEGVLIAGEGDNTKGDLDGYEVEILDAVLADGENSKVFVIEFEFKNNTSQEVNFSSVISANVYQDGKKLPVAPTFSAEGYEILTVAQNIKHGEKIKVQKAYTVNDTTLPITVEVSKHENVGGSAYISKTFDLQ